MTKVLITGGPTNEYIDDVMKITNMATGKTAIELASRFSAFADVTVVGSALLHQGHIFNNVRHIPVETTAEMRAALEHEQGGGYNMVIHSAAVADYYSEFSFTLEDMADEIAAAVKEGKIKSNADVLKIMTNPQKKILSNTKISSVEENLTIKLGLTPKIIAELRKWFPEAILVGFKLLSKVSQKELFDAATELCRKNKMDYIIANDLSVLKTGFREGHLVTADGYQGKDFTSNREIFEFLDTLLAH
jgi:Phosphopantothenoylcysteine synthetase/decarboxylase